MKRGNSDLVPSEVCYMYIYELMVASWRTCRRAVIST